MDSSINKEVSKEDIWIWLAEILSSDAEDYGYIAMHLTKNNIEELEKIFFDEVAPICYESFPLFPRGHWDFEEAWLIESIKKRLAARQRSFIRTIAGDIYIKYLRKACAEDWNAFKKAYFLEQSGKNL